MERIEGDVAAVREALEENTRTTEQVRANTADMVEFFQAAKGAFKVLNWIGKAAKPMAYVVGLGTAVLGFWAALKGHFK